ncbi:MAG: NAD(P)-dependent oxidoreductase [Candidatus Limnocylindrales bacterium]|jgi:nucleoside-diphosphate-sugar epimerase
MRILLTGATGFIGAHVARALLTRGAEVHGMTLPGAPRDRLAEVASGLELREGDLADAAWVRDAVRSIAPEAAIHLAWYAEPRSYLRAVPENLASLRGGVNLLEALAEGGTCRRVVLAGTCLENLDTPRPTVYAAAKAAQHRLALGFSDRSMAAACAHIHYLYGPWEDERRVVPTVTRALLHGERIDVTEGMQRRDYLHVADVAEALCRVAESDLAGRVDICTGAPVRLRDVFEEIARATGGAALLRIGAREESESTEWPATGDPAPLLTTGWQPRYGLQQGIRETTAWWNARERIDQ